MLLRYPAALEENGFDFGAPVERLIEGVGHHLEWRKTASRVGFEVKNCDLLLVDGASLLRDEAQRLRTCLAMQAGPGAAPSFFSTPALRRYASSAGRRVYPAGVNAECIGRAALLALFLSTPYVRPGGLGEVHARALPRRPAVIVVLVLVAAIPMTMGSDGLWMLASVFTAFMLTRAAMLRRLGGTTGDTAGAVVEITESAVLITAAMV